MKKSVPDGCDFVSDSDVKSIVQYQLARDAAESCCCDHDNLSGPIGILTQEDMDKRREKVKDMDFGNVGIRRKLARFFGKR